MARVGAREVVSFDIAEQNGQTTARNGALFNLDNIRTQCGSLLDLPFADDSFDVVWCNGVLHHTVDPDRALYEVSRVLRVGGNLWLYFYGSGGIYWLMVDFFREWLGDLGIDRTMLMLSLFQTPTGRIAEFIDDWYVPNLKRYTREDIESRLAELGFDNPQYLKAGKTYDTSTRRGDSMENIWMGGGDLRHWAIKTSTRTGSNDHTFPDVDGIGSVYTDAEEVTRFAGDFGALRKAVQKFVLVHPDLDTIARVAVAARLQKWLRDTFTNTLPFNGEAFREQIRTHILFFETAMRNS